MSDTPKKRSATSSFSSPRPIGQRMDTYLQLATKKETAITGCEAEDTEFYSLPGEKKFQPNRTPSDT